MKPASQSNWHTMIDARNRELHQLIAGKIRHDPALMLRVEKTLERWLRAMDKSDRSYAALLEWNVRFERHSVEELLEFISSEDEEARRLRQASPFIGLLSDEERMAVFRKYEASHP
jgi:hypothetical protein